MREYHAGDLVFDLPIRWATAATTSAPLTAQTDAAREQIAAGAVLPMQMLASSNGVEIKAYCTPRRAAERTAERGALGVLLGGGSLWRGLIRGATDRQTCFIDSDGDAQVDQSLLVGDGSPDARTPRPISPVKVQFMELVPVSSADRAQLYLTKIGRNWAEFTLRIVQQGHPRVFTEMSGSWGTSSKITRIKLKGSAEESASKVRVLGPLLEARPDARSYNVAVSGKPTVTLP